MGFRGCGAALALLAAGCNGSDKLVAVGTTDAAGVACVSGTLALGRAQPAVMLVLDRSGSMDSGLGGARSGATRWSSLQAALSSTLPAVNDTMELGALFFPAGEGALSCSAVGAPELQPALGNVPALLQLLAREEPAGATPTADALAQAVTALEAIRAGTTARALILATDGAPNCDAALDARTCECASGGLDCRSNAAACLDDDRTVAEIAAYRAEGLPTYVIGIQDAANVVFVDVLNAMAAAGGRPQTGGAQAYYAATSQAELTAAFAAIRDQVGACAYLTTSVPDALGNITVTFNGVAVPYDETGENGWMWTNKATGEIALRGVTCDAVAAAAAPVISATVVCGDADGGSGAVLVQ